MRAVAGPNGTTLYLPEVPPAVPIEPDRYYVTMLEAERQANETAAAAEAAAAAAAAAAQGDAPAAAARLR